MLQLVSLRTKTLNLRGRCARGPVDSQGPVEREGEEGGGPPPPRACSCARAVIGAHGNLHLDCDDLILARARTCLSRSLKMGEKWKKKSGVSSWLAETCPATDNWPLLFWPFHHVARGETTSGASTRVQLMRSIGAEPRSSAQAAAGNVRA